MFLVYFLFVLSSIVINILIDFLERTVSKITENYLAATGWDSISLTHSFVRSIVCSLNR